MKLHLLVSMAVGCIAIGGILYAAKAILPVDRATDCLESPDRIPQALHSQIELYQIQHEGRLPTSTRPWDQLIHSTNAAGEIGPTLSPSFPFGPYIQSPPVNPLNGKFAVGTTLAPDVGWIYLVNGDDFILRQVNETGDGFIEIPYSQWHSRQ